jgi:flagellar basal body-associated protein FliL
MTESQSAGEQLQVVEAPRKRPFLRFLATAMLMLGVGVAGTLLGPRLLAGAVKSWHKSDTNSEHSATDEIPVNSMAMQPLIVDVRGKGGEAHHMRVGLTAEMAKGLKKEDFEKLQPRGREVAISFLRAKTFEELTEPAQFSTIVKDLGERVTTAMGKNHTTRIIITDYVVQ